MVRYSDTELRGRRYVKIMKALRRLTTILLLLLISQTKWHQLMQLHFKMHAWSQELRFMLQKH